MGLTAVSGIASAQAAGTANVPRAVYITTMDQEFGKMDADKNSQVTRAEAEAFQRATAVAESGKRMRAMFAQLDSNKDGKVSLVEHRAGKLLRFDQIDADKDGVVTAAEMRTAGVIK